MPESKGRKKKDAYTPPPSKGERKVARLGSPSWLAPTMVTLFVVGLAVNLLSTTAFAAILFNLYRHLGSDGKLDLSRWSISPAAGPAAGFRITRGRLLAAGILGAVVALATGIVAIRPRKETLWPQWI